MVLTTTNYLDLSNILIYEVIGSVWLFIAIGIFIIAYLCARFSVPFQVTIASLSLFIAISTAITGNLTIWVFLVLGIGILFYWMLARILRRG